MNGIKTRPRFKNFSIKLHDLAYSPILKHKIGGKRKRLLRHESNVDHNEEPQKRTRLSDGIDERTSSTTYKYMTTSEEADSTVKPCEVEQCWMLRKPFIETFDLDQYEDSRDAARTLLKWLIYPVQCDKFLKYCMTNSDTVQ